MPSGEAGIGVEIPELLLGEKPRHDMVHDDHISVQLLHVGYADVIAQSAQAPKLAAQVPYIQHLAVLKHVHG